MTSMWPLGLLLCSCLLSVTAFRSSRKDQNSTYWIVYSKTMRPGWSTTIGVHIGGATEPVDLCLEVIDYNGHYLQEKQLFRLENPNGFQTVKFMFSKLLRRPTQSIYLRATAEGGVHFDDFNVLLWRDRPLKVFVQLDKSVYEPGGTVQFRAFPMRMDMTVPLLGVSVVITDKFNTMIAKYDAGSMSLTAGVYQGKMPLPRDARPGEYRITAKATENSKTRAVHKFFTVSKLEKPAFSLWMSITLPERFTGMSVRLNAKHLFGAPVAGSGKVVVRVRQYYWYRRSRVSTKELVKKFTLTKRGKAEIKFSENETSQLMCSYSNGNYYWGCRSRYMTFAATVEDHHLNKVVKETESLYASYYSYYLRFRYPTMFYFKPGLPFKAYVEDTSSYGRPNPKPKTLSYTVYYRSRSRYRNQLLQNATKVDIDEDTKLYTLKVDKVPGDAYYVIISVRHPDRTYACTRYFYRSYSPSGTFLQVDTEKELTADKRASITLMSNKEFNNYTILMVSKGAVVDAETVTSKVAATTFVHKLRITDEMAPSVHIVTYFIAYGKEVVAASMSLDVDYKKRSEQQVILKAKESGGNVKVTLKRNEPNTAVFLLAKPSYKGPKGNDFNVQELNKALQYRDTASYYRYYMYRRSSAEMFRYTGLGTIGNLNMGYRYYYNYYVPRDYRRYGYYYRYGSYRYRYIPPPPAPPGLRQRFPSKPTTYPRVYVPDTLTFESFTTERQRRSAEFEFDAPESPSTVKISGFAVHPEDGLKMTQTLEPVKVEKDVFITMFGPESAVLGETVCLQIIIYLSEEAKTSTGSVTLPKGEFEVVTVKREGNTTTENFEMEKKAIDISLNAPGITSVKVCVKPTAVGNVQVSPKVQIKKTYRPSKTIHVKPGGLPQHKKYNILVENSSSTVDIQARLHLPDKIADKSYKISIQSADNVVGFIAGHLGHLVDVAPGSGDQAVVDLATSTAILNYAKSSGIDEEKLIAKAKMLMQMSYHQLLLFQTHRGSFSPFGHMIPFPGEGSLWVTAMVVQSLGRASPHYINVDPDVVIRALYYLTHHQGPDGGFSETGTVYHPATRGSSAYRRSILTAYVFIALTVDYLETGNLPSTRVSAAKKQAIKFLAAEVEKRITDPFASCIVAFALSLDYEQRQENGSAKKALDQMKECAVTKSGDQTFFVGDFGVDMAAYALMATLNVGNSEDATAYYRFLISKIGHHGGFETSQATMLGVQALAAMHTHMAGSGQDEETEFDFTVTVPGANPIKVHETLQPLQTKSTPLQVDGKPEDISVKAELKKSPNGFAFAQLVVYYNDEAESAGRGYLTVDASVKSNNVESFTLKFCVSPSGHAHIGDDSIIVAEVNLPSASTLNKKESTYAPTTRAQVDRGKVILHYLASNLTSNECPRLKIDTTKGDVAHLKPFTVRAYSLFKYSDVVFKQVKVKDYGLCDVDNGYSGCAPTPS